MRQYQVVYGMDKRVEIIDIINRLYASGMVDKQIAERLNELGYVSPTGLPWKTTNVWRFRTK